jgi:hypothetical protein
MEPKLASLRFIDMASMRKMVVLTSLIYAVASSIMASSPAAVLASSARVPYLPVPQGAAVILDTGSTNASGYRIVVQANGTVEYTIDGTPQRASISGQSARAFFADLAAAAPLDHVTSQPCMKSVSFGTSLYVWWWAHGRSGDLRCPTDEHGAALRTDADSIARELGLARGAGPVMRPLMPGEHHKPLPQGASPSPTSS